MMRDQIEVGLIQREDGGITLQNVPYGNERITIGIRPLSNKDRKLLRQWTELQDPDREEKLQALLIDQFGDRTGITAGEIINNQKYAETYLIVDDAMTLYIFRKRHVFVPVKPERVDETNIHPEQQELRELERVG